MSAVEYPDDYQPLPTPQMARLLDQLNRLPDSRYRRLLDRLLEADR